MIQLAAMRLRYLARDPPDMAEALHGAALGIALALA